LIIVFFSVTDVLRVLALPSDDGFGAKATLMARRLAFHIFVDSELAPSRLLSMVLFIVVAR
jgi:hypothetical protein